VADEVTEERVDRIERKLDELLSAGHATAEQHEEDKLGRPTDVQEMVRRELEAKEAAAADKAAKDADQTDRKTMREQVAEMRAKMAERPPVQPQPRRQRVMWGKR
jgi:hypothetical protein